MVAPFLHGEALEEDEAFAIEEVLAEVCKEGGELGKREVALLLLALLVGVDRGMNTTFEIPVRGVVAAKKASAVALSSAISSAEKRWVHFSGASL